MYQKNKFWDDVDYFIRMATRLRKIDEEYLSLTFKVAILFIIFIGIFFVVALKISKKVEYETNLYYEVFK